MNDLEISIKQLLATITEYLEHGKYKILLWILLLMSSILMIYAAGKSFGEFIYYFTI
jgi:hypothetical protein